MYRERFEDAAFVPKAYSQRIRLMVEGICKRHGIPERSGDALLTRELGMRERQSDLRHAAQSSLFPLPLPPQRSAAAQRVMMVS